MTRILTFRPTSPLIILAGRRQNLYLYKAFISCFSLLIFLDARTIKLRKYLVWVHIFYFKTKLQFSWQYFDNFSECLVIKIIKQFKYCTQVIVQYCNFNCFNEGVYSLNFNFSKFFRTYSNHSAMQMWC